MGRPRKYRYSKATAEKVRQMAALKMSVNSISAAIGMPAKATSRYYEKDIEAGRALGQEAAANVVMTLIGREDLQAAKFYLETSPEWNKKSITELSGPDGGAIEIEETNSAVELLSQMLGLKNAKDEG